MGRYSEEWEYGFIPAADEMATRIAGMLMHMGGD